MLISTSLALDFTLRTSSPDLATKFGMLQMNGSSNPYILPFAVRGLLEEDIVRKAFSSEATELLRLFDEWEPATKGLKDLKYRL